MTTQTKAVEEGIKIALDAADAATNVIDEFARIKQDYSAVEGEVKKLYKNATIVFASSAAASLIAVIAASMMYYRTMETMETSNNTSLEALVIFAENVDKLALATTSLDEALTKQSEMSETAEATNIAVSRIEESQAEAQAITAEGLAELSETTTAVVSQFSTAMLEKFDADLAQQTDTISQALDSLEAAQSALSASLAAQDNPSSADAAPNKELTAKLETVLMLQREISAKITAANSPPPKSRKRPTPTATAKPRRTSDAPITFP